MRTFLLGLLALVLMLGALPTQAAQPAAPDESAFLRVWERTDALVANGAVQRTWYWGPAPLYTFDEEYAEGVDGMRRVQYWDKGRMEISNPNDDSTSPWYVSSGLLPLEMIAGVVQIGDTDAEVRSPAEIPIAGDANSRTNPDAPTYSDFFNVTTVLLDSRLQPITSDPIGPIAADAAAPPRFGDLVSEGLSASGEVVPRPELAAAYPGTRLVYYDGVLSHNIPEVFWDFLQQVGKVQVNGEERQDLLMDWLYMVGHPASEPYWITTNVDGVPKDLMVQVYERRVLTYMPENAPAWQVQMGNVGRDYHLWRYELTDAPPLPNLVRPDNVNATVEPPEGPAGTEFAVTLFGFEPGEDVSIWLTFPDDTVLEAPELGRANDNGEATLFGEVPIAVFTTENDPVGVWALTGEGASSGNTAIGYLTVLPPE
jgi:hypothetical protein